MLDSADSIDDKRNKKKKKSSKLVLHRFLARIFDFLVPPCSSLTATTTSNSIEAGVVGLEDESPAPGVLSPVMEEEVVGRVAPAEQEPPNDGAVEPTAAAMTRKAVKQLHFGECEEVRLAAAAEIKKLAAGDPRRKRLVAALGVVPPLVSLLVELKDDRRRKLVVETLVELAHGTFKNKALIVEAGLLVKLPQLMSSEGLPKTQHLAPLLLSLSSLAKTQFPIDPNHMLPFVIQMLDSVETTDDMKRACVATLYNLSTKLDNIRAIVSGGAVHVLLKLSQNRKASEGALTTLGNLMLTETGKKAIDEDSIAPEALMEVMAWEDEPKCQELAAYILMVLAHRSKVQRQKMAELRIVPLLLEVALLGSPLAQKRALKILQCFKHEGSARIGGHSGPQTEQYLSLSSGSAGRQQLRECKRAVKNMVKQSLDKNLQAIIRRANGSEDFSCLKSLATTSSSKSLPY
ncbi:hypothetical protein Cni_G00066 [Canna indica]|uniref:ARM repeat superfamily protein n=1 Tax=Canna indica TaxID=4628 RepID=A0AAQ3PYV5_9LILI|nr:hypothetical protein Cni_G00066 [Canna indica]